MTRESVRLLDAATVAAVLVELAPATADAVFACALTRAFPEFSFPVAAIDDLDWRDTRTVSARDGTRHGNRRAWISQQWAALGDQTAFWVRPRSVDDLMEPSWASRDDPTGIRPLARPVYRLLGRASGAIVHPRGFLGRRARSAIVGKRAGRNGRRARSARSVPKARGVSGSSTPPREA